MKMVITNDDGFGEPGIEALQRAVQPLGEVVIVAPRQPHSFGGHRVTMKDPIRVEQMNAHAFAVHGSPADCTRLALKQFAPDADWVISGINPGANLGTDIFQSGTIAAAREAAILGVKAIAISQYISHGQSIAWESTRKHAALILSLLMGETLNPGQYWNINLPHPHTPASVLAHVVCPIDKNPHDYTYTKSADIYQYQGIIHNRPREAGSDVAVCFGGKISVTRLEI